MWHPPLAVLIGVARDAMRDAARGETGLVVWVGPACWPYPHALTRREQGGGACTEDDLRRRSLFIDARRPAERVWAIDLALRSPAVSVVVADGSGLAMPESRRLQLAAGGGTGNALALLARPPWEERELSAAKTRWRVTPQRTQSNEQAWTVELLRCKGLQPEEDARRWTVRRDHATGTIGKWIAERAKGDVGVAAPGPYRLPQEARTA